MKNLSLTSRVLFLALFASLLALSSVACCCGPDDNTNCAPGSSTVTTVTGR